MKRTETVSLRVSEPVKKALVHITKNDNKPESAVLVEAVVAHIAERGISLPADCPEYHASEGRSRRMKRVCFLVTLISPWKLRLSHVKTVTPATSPAGNRLSWLLRTPKTHA
jgi:hypothetical protein